MLKGRREARARGRRRPSRKREDARNGSLESIGDLAERDLFPPGPRNPLDRTRTARLRILFLRDGDRMNVPRHSRADAKPERDETRRANRAAPRERPGRGESRTGSSGGLRGTQFVRNSVQARVASSLGGETNERLGFQQDENANNLRLWILFERTRSRGLSSGGGALSGSRAMANLCFIKRSVGLRLNWATARKGQARMALS